MFINKLSSTAESHISGHFNNDAFTTTDLDAFGITGNVCRGSLQNITIFPPKKLSLLVISFSILLTAIMLYVCVIKASSHIINFVSLIILYLILHYMSMYLIQELEYQRNCLLSFHPLIM